MPLRTVHDSDERLAVALSGQLDSAGAAALAPEFHALLVDRYRPTIVDLSEVEFVMSLALNMLTQAASMLKKHGSKMVLLAPRPLVRKAIHNVALDKLAPIAETPDEARALLEG